MGWDCQLRESCDFRYRRMRRDTLFLVAMLCLVLVRRGFGAEAMSSYQLKAMPAGYHLQICDDCGVPDRQPHVHAKDIYTFGPDVAADEKARTVAWGEKQVQVRFDRLDVHTPYVVAVTYANEPFNHRVQSIWAGAVQLQPPHACPRANPND